ncbi:MAG: hypothetical protein HQL35_12195 [Alphaproteobacteria bacterium]|nr:hypothetical protein [Alphaproteobacteria bacterium]
MVDIKGLYKVGIDEIDAEHDAISKAGYDIHMRLMRGESSDVLLPLLRDYVGLIDRHFSNEERLAENLGKDHVKQHVCEHQRILEDLAQHVESLPDQELSRWKHGFIAMLDGLYRHVVVYDRILARDITGRT